MGFGNMNFGGARFGRTVNGGEILTKVDPKDPLGLKRCSTTKVEVDWVFAKTIFAITAIGA